MSKKLKYARGKEKNYEFWVTDSKTKNKNKQKKKKKKKKGAVNKIS